MSKIFFISLLFLCSVVSTTFIQKPELLKLRPGNFNAKKVTPEIIKEAKTAIRAIDERAFEGEDKPSLIYYAEQIVAGKNMNMVWKIDASNGIFYSCQHIHKMLNNKGYRQIDPRLPTTLMEEACNQCGGPDDCSQDP